MPSSGSVSVQVLPVGICCPGPTARVPSAGTSSSPLICSPDWDVHSNSMRYGSVGSTIPSVAPVTTLVTSNVPNSRSVGLVTTISGLG